jgi:hypothetical protein
VNPHQESPPAASKRRLAVTGVMLVIFLFAIDATIVSTAMPTIVAKLGGLELYSWVFSIYMLTSALTTPLFGKLSDLYSRRRLMLIGIGVFVLGSMLCGAAQSMEALIVFRAVQGLGGGAIYALSFIVVGILYPPEERAKVQGIISVLREPADRRLSRRPDRHRPQGDRTRAACPQARYRRQRDAVVGIDAALLRSFPEQPHGRAAQRAIRRGDGSRRRLADRFLFSRAPRRRAYRAAEFI